MPDDVRKVPKTLNTTTISAERQRVLDLHEAGLTPREIARVLDLSPQRIYQQLSKLDKKPNPRSQGAQQ